MSTPITKHRELLAELNTKIERLTKERNSLVNDIRKHEAAEFVRANGITRADVEGCDGPGKPYFDHVWLFADWLKTNSKKPWAAWNTQIHHTSNLIAGRFTPTPATTEDVP